MIEEFRDGFGSEQGDTMCENLLNSVEADPDQVWRYCTVVIGLFVLFRTAALFILRRKVTKFF
jgi:hypothetical protein